VNACLSLGKRSEAHDWLNLAQEEVSTYDLTHRKPDIDQVAARF
jgi:hypothetical protein